MDTYKIGTVSNSTSTMHKLTSKEITKDCFELDDFNKELYIPELDTFSGEHQFAEDDDGNITEPKFEIHTHADILMDSIIYKLENLRKNYLETKDIRYWKELVRWLPESWLQTRTWTANYEILRNIYHQRKNHKLTEWHSFCNWIETLPYANDLIISE